jgi:hypothetical protein
MQVDDVREKIGILTAKADAAHTRVDRLESGVRQDLSEIKNDLKELSAYMHREKGWSAAFLFLAGLAGAGLMKLAALAFGN